MKPIDSASDSAPDSENLSSDSLQPDRSASNDSLSPLENLQRRYADQLSQDIEQLEAEKTKLQIEVATLKQDYAQLHQKLASLDQGETTRIPKPSSIKAGPRLPGEQALPPELTASIEPPTSSIKPDADAKISKNKLKNKLIELPTPATSEQRRARVIQREAQATSRVKAATQRGLILSAIATFLTVWHYGLVGSLTQGGSWLGINIGQLGIGFVPAVALLWLRMLVIVPALVMLAPMLYKPTWDDLQNWFGNHRPSSEQIFIPLIGSGVALFFSQVLLYQSIGLVGAVIGSALLFLYPLSAIPLELGLGQGKPLTLFGWVALVAIAMGGFLIARPILTESTSGTLWLGLAASLALSLYILLTNLSYRRQCHPIPTGIVQFSTVAVLSSLVLLIKPLTLVSISWLGLCLWGILIGFLTLIAYLFTYVSLRTIGSKTALVAASTPLIMLLLSWGFTPTPTLEIIQWTGIFLITLGGMALGKEKIAQRQG